MGTMEIVRDFIFLGSKITADGECSLEIKRLLLLGRKTMTKLDSILKTCHCFATKVHLFKTVFFFPVIVFGCEWVIVVQSCLTLCNPMDWSLSGSSVHGFLQARLLEWVAISFSNGCQSWTINKAECWKIDAFELWFWRRLLRMPWTEAFNFN